MKTVLKTTARDFKGQGRIVMPRTQENALARLLTYIGVLNSREGKIYDIKIMKYTDTPKFIVVRINMTGALLRDIMEYINKK